MCSSWRRRLGALVAAIFILPLWPLSGLANAPLPGDAHVVSTPELAVRECPAQACSIVVLAPLGADITITGDEVDGFMPVTYAGTAGYVPSYFVANDPADPPLFIAGAPGCQRVAFLFNIGVGFPPDDGILETLQSEDVPAAMFVMGWWVEQEPPPTILSRMVDDGYLIGSHGYGATELTSLPDDAVIDDVTHAAAAIEEVTGAPAAPFFTPYAAATDDRVRSLVAAQGLLSVAWEVPAADYGEDVTADDVYSRVMNNIYDGAIVEFHLDAEASAESTGVALPQIISDLREMGYQFVSIPDMMLPCSGSNA